jgi:hypothetical protein
VKHFTLNGLSHRQERWIRQDFECRLEWHRWLEIRRGSFVGNVVVNAVTF